MEDRLLASVRDGSLELDQMLANARDLLTNENGREALYDGLRDRITTMLRSDLAKPIEFAALRDKLRRISALALSLAPNDKLDAFQILSIRLEALADQAADAASFTEAYKLEDLRRQPHFEKCVLLLADHGGQMDRGELLVALSLKEANGTRVLKVLEKARLIVREKHAQFVSVTLTILGHRKAEEWAPQKGGASHLALSQPLNGLSRSKFGIVAPRARPTLQQ